MRAVAAIVLSLLLAPAAHAASWSKPKVFTGTAGEDAVPRAAITAAGKSTVAWRRHDKRLVMSTNLHRPKVIARGVRDFAVAPGAVAWEAADGLWVYAGGKARRVAESTGSEINGVAIAADPLGGWVVAERQYPRKASGKPYRVRALSLDATGAAVGPVQDLGLGQFGIDALQTQNLEVLPDGRALLVFQRDAVAYTDPEPVVLSTRPHGGAFSEPIVVGDGLTDARVNGGTLTVTQTAQCGDSGCAGQPRSIAVDADGTLGAPVGPALPNPRRAFAPFATANALVFLLKTGSQPFSKEAPVMAYTAAHGLQTITHEKAHEPVALPLSGGRTLALWATRSRLGAALAGPDGTFKKTAAPAGSPPPIYHFNATNRDARSAGAWVIFTWSRGNTVRISVRH